MVVTKFLSSQIAHRYPEYDFIAQDQNVSMTAANITSRYSEESMRGVVIDIELLSQTNFLVCTLSSNVSHTQLLLQV